MNSTMQLIFMVVGGALVLLSIYGAAKLDRRLYLSGFCFYSILPIIGEGMAYNADKGAMHLLMVFIFLVQFVLQIPDKNLYGRDNSSAVTLATKIGLAIIIINAGAAIYVLCLNTAVPAIFGYYHIVFVLLVAYIFIRRFTSNVSWAK